MLTCAHRKRNLVRQEETIWLPHQRTMPFVPHSFTLRSQLPTSQHLSVEKSQPGINLWMCELELGGPRDDSVSSRQAMSSPPPVDSCPPQSPVMEENMSSSSGGSSGTTISLNAASNSPNNVVLRPQEPPPPTPTDRNSTVLMIPDESSRPPSGVDNPGFEEDEEERPANGNASFLNSGTVDTSMLTSQEEKKDKDVAEAVNLELVNMNPFSDTNGVNGIPVKKEGEENTDAYNDPYDEYFVPVNEHRKYMR
ncbi:hypothetical protein C0J52_19795 [Blattella germanica]|nr:hypothetical protein C0J52_19795 [Blattella germanica]